MAITSQAVQAKRDLRIGDKIFTFLKYFLLILFSIIALIPVSVCVLTAFKTTDEYNTTNVLTPPQNWLNFDNFVTAFERANMLRGFLNTGIALVFVLLFSILISSMLAYVLNRFRFPGSGLIHNLFMFASLIPGIATQVTVYQIMFSLGLINHLYGYILVLCGTDIIPTSFRSTSSCSSLRTCRGLWTRAPSWMAAPTSACSSRSCCRC